MQSSHSRYRLSTHRLVLPVVVFAAACATGSRVPPSPSAAAAAPDAQPVVANGADAGAASAPGAAQVQAPLTSTDLDARTAALFGDGLRLDSAIPAPVDTGALEVLENTAPTWDIDVRSYEAVARVQHFIEAFTGPARQRFVDRLEKGTRYEAMIRERMRAGDLPEDMYYLAFVESGFNPHAYSSAAAVGMWQFMTSTGRSMGLRVDWWIDERRDPVRSTQAAVRFLGGLREQFGSIYLAAAAYNGGPGRIARGLEQFADNLEGTTGDDVFFALAEQKYLRTETRDYVPQLVAAALVAKEPARHGIAFDTLEAFAYDSVRVAPRVPLAAIARAAGTTLGEIQALNPHILRGMTAPTRDSMTVRVPVGSADRFDSVFARLPASATVGATTVKAPAGATWASLGKKAGVSARDVSTYNPKVKASPRTGTIATGTLVLVPTPVVAKARLAVPDPAIERYGSSGRTHVVRRGENLSVIAKRYGTTANTIMRLNRLKKPLIFPGQELVVRGRSATPQKAPIRKPSTGTAGVRGGKG